MARDRPTIRFARFIVGFGSIVVLAIGLARLTAEALAACGDLETNAYIALFVFPQFLVALLAAWLAGVIARARIGPQFGLLVFAIVAIVGSWLVLSWQVPGGDPSSWAGATHCRSDGIPTWWPSALPI